MLVYREITEHREVYNIARAHYRIGQHSRLFACHAAATDSHAECRSLIVGYITAGIALDKEAYLRLVECQPAALFMNDIIHSHAYLIPLS